ncbi:hypothetical protein FHX81_5670 [Saccharothrix saharensis]|uniref:Uncharacterized protein n=1 Tax=Saccharothrix saharensis TaxID=571190 RepID=A0A543JK72_9PSEU|nr:hypothetical protein [Saccharothrix saharensis]TQM83252.1 hypothetical protein FHX81_5670 [Saccharothrix saharensis]
MTEPVNPAHAGHEHDDRMLHAEFLVLRLHGCRFLRLREGLGEHVTADHGDTVDYDDLRTVDWTADLVELPVRYSDSHGSDLDVVNQQYLIETFGAKVFVHLRDDRDGARGIGLPVCRPLPGDDADNSALDRLTKELERLRVVGLLDEDRHSQYVDTLADSAWRSHLRAEVITTLRTLAPDSEEDRAVVAAGLDADDPIGETYFGFEGNEWIAVTPYRVRNGRHHDAVMHVATTLFGWEV